MTFSPPLANPVSMWDEHPLQLAATPLSLLVPYKTTAGYWVLVPPGLGPVGSTQGALVHGASYDTLLTSTTVGLRHTRNAAGFVFSF